MSGKLRVSSFLVKSIIVRRKAQRKVVLSIFRYNFMLIKSLLLYKTVSVWTSVEKDVKRCF